MRPGNDRERSDDQSRSIVQATDFDGDSVRGDANGLVITVDDDTPIATARNVDRDG